nr:hypothetical protein [Herbaspirillum sp. ASV7]
MANIPSALRLLLLSLTLALTACSTCLTCVRVINPSTTPTLGRNTTITSYNDVITKLAVFIVEPQTVTSVSLTGGYGRAPTSGRTAIADTEAAFKSVFAKYLNEHGLPAELASSDSKDNASDIRSPAGSTHLLLLAPSGARTQCHSGCQSSVDIHVMLKDLTTNVVVWDGYLSVTEGSAFGHINEDDAEKSAALILEAFRKNRLVSGS